MCQLFWRRVLSSWKQPRYWPAATLLCSVVGMFVAGNTVFAAAGCTPLVMRLCLLFHSTDHTAIITVAVLRPGVYMPVAECIAGCCLLMVSLCACCVHPCVCRHACFLPAGRQALLHFRMESGVVAVVALGEVLSTCTGLGWAAQAIPAAV